MSSSSSSPCESYKEEEEDQYFSSRRSTQVRTFSSGKLDRMMLSACAILVSFNSLIRFEMSCLSSYETNGSLWYPGFAFIFDFVDAAGAAFFVVFLSGFVVAFVAFLFAAGGDFFF